ncbi:MAG: 3-hydroxyacyl-CoA dehydrogenase/enoyl-CoA hydratase family protein [Anaerolineales bacterium]|nr:3-hydroxyacyl-CoA dehydrogenase/enoyl-CoA hydratase family protein [Anaerolineales bacterium]
MKYRVHKAVVIGSGTMGAALAAHLANAGVPVTLLDIVPKDAPEAEGDARDKLARDGLERAEKSRPASFFSEERPVLVRIGNLEDDFEQVIGQADWIIEAIIENLQIKQDLMKRIDPVRKPAAIVSTNTSGIPVNDIAAGCSQEFKQHFLGAHFFNPPRYLKLLEVIPTTETLPEVVKFISWFGEYRLGKGVVLCKDTPNFIGNRVAFGTGAFALDFIVNNGYTVEEVDAVTGKLIGRPKTATFRLIDLVGIDVWDHVGRNLIEAIPHDSYAMPYLRSEKPNALISKMIEKNWLGNKAGVGFYKAVRVDDGKKEFWPLDLEKLEHVPPVKPRFDSIGKARDVEELGERLRVFLGETDKAAKLVQALTYQGLQYASALLPEVADTGKPIDDAIRWGFGHQAGPFETWDMLGVAETTQAMKTAGFEPAHWVSGMLASGITTFYQYDGSSQVGVFDVGQKKYVPIERPAGLVLLKELRQAKKVISENAGAALFDTGDGVALLEFHTKMNTLDDDILTMAQEALERVDTDFDGLVVGCEAENFSAGANLFMVVVAAQQGMWDTLDEVIRKLQGLNMRMRYFPKPIVMAPAGLALGGGCEVAMHGSRVVAAAETYIGLVEMGAGVIPAGAGTKEYVRRIITPPMRIPDANVLPFLQKAFLQIGQAKVATSAEEARQMGIFGLEDRIVMNRDHLLTEARLEVLHMVAGGYSPPLPLPLYAAGRDMLGAAKVSAWMFQKGGYMTEYDLHIAGKLAHILTGGNLSKPQWVSEQYFLDLEREAFLSLCGEEKTQQRMWAILQTGKPLRN